MEGIVTLIILIIAFFLLVVLPLLIAYVLNKVIAKMTTKSYWKVLALTPIIVSTFLIYFSFYPSDSHYKEIYNQVTTTVFPDEAYILATYSGDPIFLEGHTLFMVELEPSDYHSLQEKMYHSGYIKDSDTHEFLKPQYDVNNFFELKPEAKIEKVILKRPSPYVYFGVAFLNDYKTIIVKKII